MHTHNPSIATSSSGAATRKSAVASSSGVDLSLGTIATVYAQPAARPEARSVAESPTMIACAASPPDAAMAAATPPGPGLAPWPESWPMMASKRSTQPSWRSCASAISSSSLVTTARRTPPARSASRPARVRGVSGVASRADAARSTSAISAASARGASAHRRATAACCAIHASASSSFVPSSMIEPADTPGPPPAAPPSST
mmetsp:Transcript_45358/g.125744  ORF Transcript_45358/g.125744 Transcript_45358/m.125744 type:complete len:202 (+) Transcript_45358:625-1230(+)